MMIVLHGTGLNGKQASTLLSPFLADGKAERFSSTAPTADLTAQSYAFQHTISFLAADDSAMQPSTAQLGVPAQTLTDFPCRREKRNLFSASSRNAVTLYERRITIVGCHQPAAQDTPSHFSVAFVTDSSQCSVLNRARLDWEEHGFCLQGDNAVYHALQYATFCAVGAWKEGWSSALDAIEGKLLDQDPVGDQRPIILLEAVNELCKLRDLIQGIRRGLPSVKPDRIHHAVFGLDQQHAVGPDENLERNWTALNEHYNASEKKLLNRVDGIKHSFQEVWEVVGYSMWR